MYVHARSLSGALTTLALSLAALVGGGCGRERAIDTTPVPDPTLPEIPHPVPGQALLAGRVVDGAGQGVVGATVTVAETDATARTDADGVYQISIPSDSTITLAASATGFATTYRESVVVASQSMIPGFDLLVLPAADVTQMNALSMPDQADARGLMAIRVHSTSDSCLPAGARFSVWPPDTATVVYARPSDTGGVDYPDTSLDSVQTGAGIALWLTATLPPGNMLVLTLDQPGCRLAAQAPSLSGLVFSGRRFVAAKAFTEADLFIEQAQ
jgi:hypothetical protein